MFRTDRMVMSRRRTRRVALTATAAVLTTLAAAGCTTPARTVAQGPDAAEPTQRSAPPAKLTSSVKRGQVLALGSKVSVRARGGTLTEVSLVANDGAAVTGTALADSSRQWASAGDPLLPSSRYTLTAAAQNADGATVERTWTFRTSKPTLTDFPAVTPLIGATVGVGHPVVVYLDHDVTYREQFEKRLSVKASRPVTGSWGWLDNRTVAYRPKTFWPANTDVTVNLDVGKTETSPGRWIEEDRTIRFHVGRAQVLRIDNATHQMTIARDGDVIRTVPVSMGKAGFTTRSGVKVIMTREESRFMDSDTVGIGGADAYALEVPFAMRLTATGEFIHGAPWSEYAQGNSNVSHGCTNVSLANAIWIYNNSLIGDPVVTVGTGRSTEPWNGLGGTWNFTWQQWQDRSATS